MSNLLASVDLGSNSFRLVVGRVVHEAGVSQIYPIDRMKETVRLAAGLDSRSRLDEPAILRAIEVLERFGERLRNFHPDRVRAVATNTFRVATNVNDFLPRAEAALGFPIETIAGREEARLIFAGISHMLPVSGEKRLMIDIGGGSTEFIVGTGFQPELLESLHLGCVTFSKQFFPNGKVTADRMRRAEIAARERVETIGKRYRKAGWSFAYGSSGTAKALAAILPATGFTDGGITAAGLEKLKQRLIEARTVENAQLCDLRPDRAAVLPGGLAIMRAAFDELHIDLMHAADGALRVGVLYDLLGRDAAHDMRSDTVRQFMKRYEVDHAQAARVRQLALQLYQTIETAPECALPKTAGESSDLIQLLGWAADLHEVGISIAHNGHNRHTAYILANADMPGFSKSEQHILSLFGLGQDGKLLRASMPLTTSEQWKALLCLRLAVLFYRRRDDFDHLPVQMSLDGNTPTLRVSAEWLANHPLSEHSLRLEAETWRRLKRPFTLVVDANLQPGG